MKKPEIHLLYPGGTGPDVWDEKDYPALNRLLNEICDHVLHRSDGVKITIERSGMYPKHKGKKLIDRVLIETWACEA